MSYDPTTVDLTQLGEDLASGKVSAADVTYAYERRIAEIDPQIRSVLKVNPDAREIAASLDQKPPSGPPIPAM